MKNYEVVFESENIFYIKQNKSLIEDYLKMVNDPEVANKISHNSKTFTYEEELTWVDKKLEENALIFSMIEKKTNEFIGNIEIMHIDENKVGEIGICITRSMQNKHYGTEAMQTIIKYGYEKVGLEKLELNVYKTNPKAIHCYEKVGFIEDGTGKTEDDIHMIYKKPSNEEK